MTRNISSSGVLFVADRVPDVGGPIEYVITLKCEGQQTLKLRCVGKVVRCERTSEPYGGFAVAATLERYEFLRTAVPS